MMTHAKVRDQVGIKKTVVLGFDEWLLIMLGN